MADTLPTLALGLTLGLSGGLAPGPLTALVVGETVRHGVRAGIAVAITPLLTDGPILLLTALTLGSLPHLDTVLGVVSLLGAAFLGWLALDTLRARPVQLEAGVAQGGGTLAVLRRSLTTNFLNPHPWLFWVTLGTPTFLKALDAGVPVAMGFLACFFLGLVGTKLLLALALGRMRAFIASRAYRLVMGVLGLALLGLAGWLVVDGLRLLGLLSPSAPG